MNHGEAGGRVGAASVATPGATDRPDRVEASQGRGRNGRVPAPFFLDWQVGSATGWGTFGLYLALHACLRGSRPIPLVRPATDRLSAPQRRLLAGVADAHRLFQTVVERHQGQPLAVNSPVLRALGNGFQRNPSALPVTGCREVGVIFFEDTAFSDAALERAGRYDRIVAGSTWNAELLRRRGLPHVEVCLQGVDPAIFYPGPRSRWLNDRFVVFSGGKLEFRKGQDLVVAAFREFRRRRPDALLMVAWHNHWPETMAEIGRSGHVEGVPERMADGRPDISGWLERNGIPRAAVLDLGLLPHCEAGLAVREADVAVFPNRAEGGTNLVAMECMASGVPTVLSANTGHLDLIEPDNCFVLQRQDAVAPTPSYGGTEGWGESSVDEIVAHLEHVYLERDEAARRGLRGGQTLRQYAWEHQVERLVETARLDAAA